MSARMMTATQIIEIGRALRLKREQMRRQLDGPTAGTKAAPVNYVIDGAIFANEDGTALAIGPIIRARVIAGRYLTP